MGIFLGSAPIKHPLVGVYITYGVGADFFVCDILQMKWQLVL
jgi:hypothetical protein